MSDQAEIVTVEIRDGEIVSTTMKAPGLPDGLHDLFCEPCSPHEPENELYRLLVVRGYSQHEADMIANGPHSAPPPEKAPTYDELFQFARSVAEYDRYTQDDQDENALLADIEHDAQRLVGPALTKESDQ